MFTIIQSHRTENLVDHLLTEYQSKNQPVFDPFIVIVPSMVLGDWLDKTIASRTGISTLVRTKFWGQYQWTLMQEVLRRRNSYLLSQNPDTSVFEVPEVAVLSPTVMQWRLFGYLTHYHNDIVSNESHPLYPILSSLIKDDPQAKASADPTPTNKTTYGLHQYPAKPNSTAQRDTRLWRLASDFARVFNRYLTHREDWLALWSDNRVLSVEQLIAEKDALSQRFDQYSQGTPPWLVSHYVELEAAQRYLWYQLFAGVHKYRLNLEKEFWRALEQNKASERDELPRVLRIFTIQQLPQTELDFLQRLSLYMDITLLHYNPSQLFWADIVDKSWLQRQKIINPDRVFLRDHGHSLLSRLGKQSRDTFAMLANLSGNEKYKNAIVHWQDNFVEPSIDFNHEDDIYGDYEDTEVNAPHNSDNSRHLARNLPQQTLLKRLQNDVLMLDETSTQQAAAATVSKAVSEQIEMSFDAEASWYDDDILQNKHFTKEREWHFGQDNSLSIHSCHSLQRQLEVLRIMIGRWLNESVAAGEKKRHVSDIVVLLPDVEQHHTLISSIFVNGVGQDGLTLPAKVTGVVDASIRQLWEAIIGFYKLLGSENARFEAAEVLDWLMLPPLFESFNLTREQMSRGCDLLIEAGFIRGFDELHLKQTLDSKDMDYRFSFAQALDRLTLGLIMPEAEITDCLYPLDQAEWQETSIPEMSLPLPKIGLNDAPIIHALCHIYKGLLERRDDHKVDQKAEDWLNQIETCVIHRYFASVDQTRSMRAIYNAMNGFKSSLRANRYYQHYYATETTKHVSTNTDRTPTSFNASQPSWETEKNLANVEQLPLKLSFMLDSIEAELESQQVSAEPTGVITFGRFGALRNVPFDLVVMLNMNLSEFPDRDRDNRYDLMKATVSRRGDRVSEDDDNGAFLDALLCARSACWIFYNGLSLTDMHEHLPANPVSELLQFLQGEVQWQISSLDSLPEDIDPAADSLQRYLPKLVKQWLVTEHPPLPFHKSLFEEDKENDFNDHTNEGISRDTADNPNNSSLENSDAGTNVSTDAGTDVVSGIDTLLEKAMHKTKLAQQRQFPPAPLWQAVYKQLKHNKHNQNHAVVTLPTVKQYQAIAQWLGSDFGQLGTINETTLIQICDLLGIDQDMPSHCHIDTTSNTYTNTNPETLLATAYGTQVRETLFNINEIDLEGQLIYQVRHPGKAYLRTQEVHVVQGEEEMAAQEPLALDNLSAYQINEQLLQCYVNTMQNDAASKTQDNADEHDLLKHGFLKYKKIMPAGIARQTTLDKQQEKLQEQCASFIEQLLANGIEIDAFKTQHAVAENKPIQNENSLSNDSQNGIKNDHIQNSRTQKAITQKTDTLKTSIQHDSNNQLIWSMLNPSKEIVTEIDISTLLATINNKSTKSQNRELNRELNHDLNHDLNHSFNLLKCLPKRINIKGVVPYADESSGVRDDAMQLDHTTQYCKQWLNILPNSASPKHLLKFWLSHLYWQVCRHTTAQQVAVDDGQSIWRFHKASSQVDAYKNVTTFRLKPIQYEDAAIELIKWAIFGQLAGQVPIVLLPVYALKYLDKLEKSDDGSYWPKLKDFSDWLQPAYGSQTVYDTCSQHAIWQYILRDQDAFQALSPSINNLAQPLYHALYANLEGLS